MDQEVLNLISQRQIAKRENQLTYPLLVKQVKRLIQTKKHECFLRFVSGIHPKHGEAALLARFQAFTRPKRPLDASGDLIHQTDLIAMEFQSNTQPSIPLNIELTESPLNSQSDSPQNLQFTSAELRFALNKVPGRTKCGPDGIPYSAFIMLPEPGLDILLRIYNCWFSTGTIPNEISKAFQIAIPKG